MIRWQVVQGIGFIIYREYRWWQLIVKSQCRKNDDTISICKNEEPQEVAK